MKHRTKKYLNKIKTHSNSYRRKLKIINEEELRKAYRERRSCELGEFRHNNKYITYDAVVNKIVNKWEEKDSMLALELIKSVQNKANSMLLEVILKEHGEMVREGLI